MPSIKHTTNLTIQTTNLLLIPYTTSLCESILAGDYSLIADMDLMPGAGWPDADVLDTLPRVLVNLAKVEVPNGFQSWMVVDKTSRAIIGDAGFKGLDTLTGSVDLGYGIIASARGKGHAVAAAAALIDWAFTQPEVLKITASCAVSNAASIAVLSRLNFKRLQIADDFIYWVLHNPST